MLEIVSIHSLQVTARADQTISETCVYDELKSLFGSSGNFESLVRWSRRHPDEEKVLLEVNPEKTGKASLQEHYYQELNHLADQSKELTTLAQSADTKENLKNRCDEMVHATQKYWESIGIRFRIISKNGHLLIEPLSGEKTAFNHFVGRTRDVLHTRIVFDPFDNFASGAKTSFTQYKYSPEPSVISMPTQVALNVNTKDSGLLHEILHAARARDLRRVRIHDTSGEVKAIGPKLRLPGASPLYTAYLSFDELDTYLLEARLELGWLQPNASTVALTQAANEARVALTTARGLADRSLQVANLSREGLKRWAKSSSRENLRDGVEVYYFKRGNGQTYASLSILYDQENQLQMTLPIAENLGIKDPGNFSRLLNQLNILSKTSETRLQVYSSALEDLSELSTETSKEKMQALIEQCKLKLKGIATH